MPVSVVCLALALAAAPAPEASASSAPAAETPASESPSETTELAPAPTEAPPSAEVPAPADEAPPLQSVVPRPAEEPASEPVEPAPEPVEPVVTEPVVVEAPPENATTLPVLAPPEPPPVIQPAPNVPIPPRYDGRGMLIAAGVVGGVGFLLKGLATITAARNPELAVGVLVSGGIFYNPLIGTALGLTAGGMVRRGRVEAHGEFFYEGSTPTLQRRFGLGWGLFGGGFALWGVTRVLGATCDGTCTTAAWELGYYGSLAMTIPGAIFGGYASGYRNYERKFRHLANVSVTPLAHRNGWGLSLSGQF